MRAICIPHVLVLRNDRSSRTGIGNTDDKRDRELLNYSFQLNSCLNENLRIYFLMYVTGRLLRRSCNTSPGTEDCQGASIAAASLDRESAFEIHSQRLRNMARYPKGNEKHLHFLVQP